MPTPSSSASSIGVNGPDRGVDTDPPGVAIDQLKEACGVFAVYAPNQPVAQLTYLGLFALQHRGQESAGMTVSDGQTLVTMKEMGLVTKVFDDQKLSGLNGHLAIGHCRYSTTGSSVWQNSQPVFRHAGAYDIALGHNGNLVNTQELAGELGMIPGMESVSSDSDLIIQMVAEEVMAAGVDRGDDRAVERAMMMVLPKLRGAFSLVALDQSNVIGVRDPNGFRPLCLGALPDGGYVLASESPALDIVGAKFLREVEPGEMVVISSTGVRSLRPFVDHTEPTLCLFEFVYFARPDTRLYGNNTHQARVRMGEYLADQAPVDADMVMGVPESGVPAAEGYALRSGIPAGHGLVKNRYIGRTFIAPNQQLRAAAVRMKLNPLKENLEGKRVIVVDDSVVRGTTQRALVKMLREAGVTEVHLRIPSPPVRWPCYYGIDTGDRSELLAAYKTVDEIRDYLGADSLAYLELDRLKAATGAPEAGFCDACFTGNYPVEVPPTIGKRVLESAGANRREEPGSVPVSVVAQLELG